VSVIDLHCHTTASDGTVAPADLSRHAAARGVDIVAVTDHDTVAGVAEATRTGEELGVRVVAGIELSTRHAVRELHVLGYFIDTNNSALLRAIDEMRSQRLERARSMIDRLRELGYDITISDVQAQAGGDIIARPHVARALVARGYVPSVRAAFTEELIGDGGRAFVAREAPSAVDAIDLIRAAGGVAVLAHPGVTHHEGKTKVLGDESVAELARAGLAGLEVDHPDHPPLIRDRLCAIADEYGLVPTGGSDWHGLPEHTLGGWTTSDESFGRLEALAVTTAGG
jgi:hypothetical protein